MKRRRENGYGRKQNRGEMIERKLEKSDLGWMKKEEMI